MKHLLPLLLIVSFSAQAQELLQAPRTIQYSKQYQVDDINPKYRRIVVRDFKVLYTESEKEIHILDIISTRQSPDVLKSK